MSLLLFSSYVSCHKPVRRKSKTQNQWRNAPSGNLLYNICSILLLHNFKTETMYKENGHKIYRAVIQKNNAILICTFLDPRNWDKKLSLEIFDI